jgi:hypothetical protein
MQISTLGFQTVLSGRRYNMGVTILPKKFYDAKNEQNELLQQIATSLGVTAGNLQDAINIANQASLNAQNKITELNANWNLLTTAQQQDAEVVTARQSTVKNKTFASLDARLEAAEQDLSVHQADTATQTKLGHVKVDNNTITIDENGVISALLNKVTMYDNGYENVELTHGWVQGYIAGSNITQSKEVDHLKISISSKVASLERQWVTDTTIDFSKISILKALVDTSGLEDPEGQGQHGTWVIFQVCAAADKSNTFVNNVAYYVTWTNGTNLTLELDTSSLNGVYHVKLLLGTSTSNWGTGSAELKIKKVWGEK